MRTDLPASLQSSLHDLAPDVLVSLYRIETTEAAQFNLSPYQEVTWQGVTYDDVPCQMTGVGQSSDGEVNRPKFSFANPGGLFTADIAAGKLDNATITRFRILKADLDADLDFKITEKFRVSRILSLTKTLGVVELRDILDGHQFHLPARAYYPPEFPHVKLG